jgi:polysaccharide deacetylase family protein (PEP-CTERM system associated)
LSVDVEDYFQVEAFADRITRDQWNQFPSRVVDNTRRVLDLLARHSARATFFTLGWVAERFPHLVREIVAGGHEVACHSHLHRPLWRLTPEEFRADTRRSLQALEQASGKKVVGYRAPTFSVVERTLWAIEILAEEGLLYDSSIFPVQHDTYGIPSAPRFTFQWQLENGGTLYEVPPTTARYLGRNWPAAGGGYLRILPIWYTRWMLKRARREAQPLVLYFHPWEIDPQQPRIEASFRSRFRHYTNLTGMEFRIAELLRSSRFLPVREVLGQHTAAGAIPVRALVSSHMPQSTARAAASSGSPN